MRANLGLWAAAPLGLVNDERFGQDVQGNSENTMQANALILEKGHLFVALTEGSFLLDTGAPTSFGKVTPIMLDGQSFELSRSYMGLTAQVLSDYVGCETAGILGADILNQFDSLIDLPQSRVCFSKAPLECDGELLSLDFCMGVPIIAATVSGNPVKLFFDTGAQISYLQDDSLSDFPAEGIVTDFYPGIGQFSTDTFRAPVRLGHSTHELRCGRLPDLLGMTLMLAGTGGIIGNEILRGRVAGYFPRRQRLILP